jgi:hypothetical protein
VVWSELKGLQQRARRSARRVTRGHRIGGRYCTVCLTQLQWGERTTRQYCSDACRQKAHRLRGAGKWPRRQKLHALYQRCVDRRVTAEKYQFLHELFNSLLYARKQGVPGVHPDAMIPELLTAKREQTREPATKRTMARIRHRVRS